MPDTFRRRKAAIKIAVGGTDVTNTLNPYLISVVAVDKMGSEVDTCDLEVDDSDGRFPLPTPGQPVMVAMGWEGESVSQVFSGIVTDVESGFARRGGGRRLWITAEGINTLGAGKTPVNLSLGEGDPPDTPTGKGPPIPFTDMASKLAGLGGYALTIDGALGALARPYWNVGGASPHHALQEFARQLGGFVKFTGGNAVAIASALSGMSAAGMAMGSVTAEWGVNLHSWRVKPFVARPAFAGGKSDWFDVGSGAFNLFKAAFAGPGADTGSESESQSPQAAPNEDTGEQQTGGQESDSTNDQSAGWVMMDGEPGAHAGGMVNIVGARPGVDGSWTIAEAEHHYARSSGYVTRCNLMNHGVTGNVTGHGWVPGQGAAPPVAGGEQPQAQPQAAQAAPPAAGGVEV